MEPGLKVMQQMEKDLTSEAGDGAAQRGGGVGTAADHQGARDATTLVQFWNCFCPAV